MWILVMFDLPTDTKPQRKAATDFRNFLLDEGFERSQFSVYARFVNGKEAYASRVARIGRNLPEKGDIQILNFPTGSIAILSIFQTKGVIHPEKTQSNW